MEQGDPWGVILNWSRETLGPPERGVFLRGAMYGGRLVLLTASPSGREVRWCFDCWVVIGFGLDCFNRLKFQSFLFFMLSYL